jgi:hypothetical protein
MKRLLLVFGLVFVAGCSSGGSGQPADYRWLGGMGQGFNNAMQQDMYLQRSQPMQVYPVGGQQQNPNYWQERQAEQQWNDNQLRKLGVTPH